MPHRRFRALALALALGAFPRAASATTIVATSVDELAAAADEIVVGEVVSVESYEHEGRIATLVTVAPEVCYLGDPVATIEITVPGGRVGNYVTWVPGADAYRVGERVLVFLERFPDGRWGSPSLAFSKFTVEDRDGVVVAVRELAGLELAPRPVAPVVAPDIERSVFEFDEIEAWILDAAGLR